MKKIILLLAFLSCANLFLAQKDDKLYVDEKKIKYDTSRIIDLSEKLGIYINTSSKYNNLELKDLNTKKKLKLQPNGQTNLGFGFNYKWIGLGVAFGLPFMNRDDDKYGSTKRTDYQLNLFARSFGIDAYLQNYIGFYLSNPDDYIDSIFTEFPNLSDMETVSLGLSAYYIFNNRKFSYKAGFTRNQIQKKSAGSLILGAFYDLNYAYSPNGFVPEELPDSIKENYSLRGFGTSVMGISIGYTYTLVLKRFFINLSLVPGIGIRYSEIIHKDQVLKLDPTASGSITFRFSLGYEGKHIYTGLSTVNSINSYNYQSIEISASTGNFKFYVGKRFNFSLRRKKHKI